jgi:hypothetical protein
MSEPVVTTEKTHELLLQIYRRNYAQPEDWININEVAISAGLFVAQAKHGLKVLESHKWVEIKRNGQPADDWQVRLAPAGLEEIIRPKATPPYPDIVDQVKAAARQNPWIAWPIVIVLASTVALGLFNQVFQALKNLGIVK